MVSDWAPTSIKQNLSLRKHNAFYYGKSATLRCCWRCKHNPKEAHLAFRVITGGIPPRQHRVLVVEDEPFIRIAMMNHLEYNGFYAREASCAADAISVLAEPNCPVDLVFSDVRMPGEMDGIGLSQWMFHNLPGIPVILVSGDPGKNAVQRNLCGREMMTKPYEVENVLVRIRTTIARFPRPTPK